MGHNSVISGHPKSIRILRVDRLSTGPPDLGRHRLVIAKYLELGVQNT